MTKILAIAQNTFKEAIRDKILYGFLFFAVCIILFSLVLGQLSLGQQLRTTIDVGLFGISLFSVLISIFIGINLLNKEIQKRTIYPVLSKPVSRAAYLLGKFFGIALVILVQMCLMLVVFFPLVKLQGGNITFGLVTALVLVYFEVLVIISMALFFTSFSSPFLSGIFCLGLFVAGRNANLIAELAKQEKLEALAPLFKGVSTVLPNLYLFYPSGKIVEGAFATVHAQFISSGYLFSTLAYGVVVCAAFLCASIIVLYRRDFL
ncbi:MAG: ABC transporter permease subunit [Deltaproteobacteria bacterium]|nr:ABC transporter permease subunit [Deltaproteobacteria bacterium]MBN2672767.1 ABC transporter permease subunit [Deltaproteobacteria bacterium]